MLLIIDPDTGGVTSTWPGSGTPDQLGEFFDHATARPSPQPAEQALRRGDARFGTGDFAGAVAAYDEAIAAGGPQWPGHDHALEMLLGALQCSDARACTARAAREAPHMPRAHPFVNVAISGVSCLSGDPPTIGSEPGDRIEALANEAVRLADASEDDHYQLYEALYAVRLRAGDAAGAHAVAERYLAFVDQQPPPRSDDERMARDLARVRAAVKLGVPERVIPVLEQAERELPRDANASARLAAAYTAAHRYADAIAACTRGLARAPGPGGAVRLLQARASAEAQAGDVAAARRDLELAREAVARIALASARTQAQDQVQHQLDGLAGAK